MTLPSAPCAHVLMVLVCSAVLQSSLLAYPWRLAHPSLPLNGYNDRMSYTEILAEVVRDLGAGSITIPMQMVHFVTLVPEFKGCYGATLNLRLENPLRIDNPDLVTEYDWNGAGPEKFSFLRIGLEFPVGGVPHRPWIYIPHASPHFGNRFQIEVLAARIEGISYGARCRVLIPRAKVESDIVVV